MADAMQIKAPVAGAPPVSPAAEERPAGMRDRAAAAPAAEPCVHRLFEQQVRRRPEAIAIVSGGHAVSYAELDGRASRLAGHLIGLGVGPGHVVAVLLERSVELVAAQIAILKTGAAYVPIDPQAPAARRQWLLADCGARMLLTDAGHETLEAGIPVVAVGAVPAGSAPAIDPDPPPSGRDVAYVMYTSGSTGTPKGVVVPHRAIVRLAVDNGYAQLDETDRVAFASNPSFDASTFEIWGALLNGGSVVVVDRDVFLDADRFAGLLVGQKITALFLTTALFNQYVAAIAPALSGLRFLLCGGEREDPAAFARLLGEGGPRHLIHCYGPTETTTFATTCEIDATMASRDRLPIGRPIAKTSVRVLDEAGNPVSVGEPGELYIGGDGVANGYLNRPALTAERFVADPSDPDGEARLYRTGDLVRSLPDGNLEFIGRNDQQVKIRGFRIELGEIEARLAGHPAVRESVVVARGDAAGGIRLLAYVVPAARADVIDMASMLRAYLRTLLPDYMLPAAFVTLDALPLTPNGKLDRRALPEPDAGAWPRRVGEPPRGETETALAAIWADLLGL